MPTRKRYRDRERLSVKKLLKMWNPFEGNDWGYLSSVEKRKIKLSTLKVSNTYPKSKNSFQKIAWLIKNLDTEKYPILVDVGIPGICGFDMADGNHRFAAAIMRGDKYVWASCSGECDYIKYFRYKGRF